MLVLKWQQAILIPELLKLCVSRCLPLDVNCGQLLCLDFFAIINCLILAMLTERIKKAEGGSAEDEKEIEELKGLLPEIKEKIEDSKESQKSARVAELALKATLVSVSCGFFLPKLFSSET